MDLARAYALALAVAACACTGSGESRGTKLDELGKAKAASRKPQAQLRAAASLDELSTGTKRTSFSILQTPALVVALDLPASQGAGATHYLRFDLLNEHGALQWRKWHAMTSIGGQGRERAAFAERTLPLENWSRNAGILQMTTRLPLAGTNLSRHRQHGHYLLQVYSATSEHIRDETSDPPVATLDLELLP